MRDSASSASRYEWPQGHRIVAWLIGFGALIAVNFFLGRIAPSGAQQIQDQFSCPVSQRETIDLFSLDSSHVWISVEDHSRKKHYIIQTSDGGNSWTTNVVQHLLSRLYFVSPTIGWALEVKEIRLGVYQQYLVRSTDGGRVWRQLSSQPVVPTSADGLQAVNLAFVSPEHGWFIASAPSRVVVYRTSDGGRTVQKVSEIPGIGNCLGIHVGRKGGIWIYGEGFALHSEDGGRSWKNPLDLKRLEANQGALTIYSGWFFGDGRGFLVGQSPDAVVLSTSDFGRRWHVAAHPATANDFKSISFWDDKNGCVSGSSTFLTCTNDGGATWSTGQSVLPAAQYRYCTSFGALAMFQSGRGWTVGDGGNVYKTSDFGRTWRPFDPLASTSK